MLHIPKVAITNASTVVSDDVVRTIVMALQVQVDRDFGPLWALDAMVSFFGPSEPVPNDWWQLKVADDSDQAGALGYHDLTALPVGFVFAKTDQQYDSSVSVTMSHELLEMLADPWIASTALHITSAVGGDVFALEVCDACEADALGYDIDGTLVSDFLLPAAFRDGAQGPYDFKGHISAPFALAPGGYESRFVQGQGWGQVTAETAPTSRQQIRLLKGPFSRFARRSSKR